MVGFGFRPLLARLEPEEPRPLPQILVLFPEDEARFKTNSIKIAATLVDSDSLIAPQSIQIILDTQIYQTPVNLQLPLITGSITNLNPGRHSLQLKMNDLTAKNSYYSPICYFTIETETIEFRNIFQLHWHNFWEK